MSDQSAPITTQPADDVKIVDAQVIAAGASYFSKEEAIGPDGKVQKDQQGNPMYINRRHEALHGEVVQMSQFEFDRLAGLEAVRTPSSAPTRPEFPRPTPFGVPLRDENDVLRAYEGPVMGDPRPQAALAEEDSRRGRPGLLSDEERLALEAQAAGVTSDDGSSFAAEDASVEEIREYIDTNKPNSEDTLALAKVNGEYDEQLVERVYEAETSREKPRSGVVEELEKASASFEETGE